jgi:hypothetical protein
MQFSTDMATIFVLLSVLISCANWLGILRWFVFKKHFSAIPILGGILGMIGILLAPPSHPVNTLKYFFWLPLLWDYGTVPLLISIFLKKRSDDGDKNGKKKS